MPRSSGPPHGHPDGGSPLTCTDWLADGEHPIRPHAWIDAHAGKSSTIEKARLMRNAEAGDAQPPSETASSASSSQSGLSRMAVANVLPSRTVQVTVRLLPMAT